MAFKISVAGHFRHPRVQVGDRDLPATFEVEGVPDADDPRPAVSLAFEVVDGVPQCREIRFTRTDHGREVRRSDLENVAVEYLLEVATVSVGMPVAGTERDDDGGRLVINLDDRGLDVFRSGVRKGRRSAYRRGPSDEELRQAAEVYRSAERAPTETVSERFGIALRTASLWIKRARELGYLPPAVNGKASR